MHYIFLMYLRIPTKPLVLVRPITLIISHFPPSPALPWKESFGFLQLISSIGTIKTNLSSPRTSKQEYSPLSVAFSARKYTILNYLPQISFIIAILMLPTTSNSSKYLALAVFPTTY